MIDPPVNSKRLRYRHKINLYYCENPNAETLLFSRKNTIKGKKKA